MYNEILGIVVLVLSMLALLYSSIYVQLNIFQPFFRRKTMMGPIDFGEVPIDLVGMNEFDANGLEGRDQLKRLDQDDENKNKYSLTVIELLLSLSYWGFSIGQFESNENAEYNHFYKKPGRIERIYSAFVIPGVDKEGAGQFRYPEMFKHMFKIHMLSLGALRCYEMCFKNADALKKREIIEFLSEAGLGAAFMASHENLISLSDWWREASVYSEKGNRAFLFETVVVSKAQAEARGIEERTYDLLLYQSPLGITFFEALRKNISLIRAKVHFDMTSVLPEYFMSIVEEKKKFGFTDGDSLDALSSSSEINAIVDTDGALYRSLHENGCILGDLRSLLIALSTYYSLLNMDESEISNQERILLRFLYIAAIDTLRRKCELSLGEWRESEEDLGELEDHFEAFEVNLFSMDMIRPGIGDRFLIGYPEISQLEMLEREAAFHSIRFSAAVDEISLELREKGRDVHATAQFYVDAATDKYFE